MLKIINKSKVVKIILLCLFYISLKFFLGFIDRNLTSFELNGYLFDEILFEKYFYILINIEII